jgi:predicted membrane protein
MKKKGNVRRVRKGKRVRRVRRWNTDMSISGMIIIIVALVAVIAFGLIDNINQIVGLGLSLIGLLIYFLPTVVALANKKRNSLAIFVLNLLLGWTLVGWVVALVWAFIRDK